MTFFRVISIVSLFVVGFNLNIHSARAEPFPGAKDIIDYNDNAYQYAGMHMCPDGALGALQLSANDFACRKLPTLAASDLPYSLQAGQNEVNGMLTCKIGDYAVGAHGENTILCQHNPDIHLGPIFVDSNGSNYAYKNGTMHGCVETTGSPVYVIVGFQDDKNQLNCAPIIGWTWP